MDKAERRKITLMNEKNNNKQTLSKWTDIPCSWVERFNIVKISVLSNLIYGFNGIPNQIPCYFVGNGKLILKFVWRGKRIRIGNII